VPIDRESSLRRAEKLLRQGRLDGAIDEYLRVVEDQPSDWNTANLLGDLFVRAGQPERAVAQYTRIADHFAREGFLQRATALYRKILKIQPGDEHSLLQSAEIAASQGLLADAKSNLSSVIENRLRRGDRRGAAEVALRLSEVDPGDFGARLQAARASIALGDRAGAIARFRDSAAGMSARGRHAEAVAVLLEAVQLDAENNETRGALMAALLDAGEIDRARQVARNPEELTTIAASLASAGRQAEALDVLADAVRRGPDDADRRARLVRMLASQGQWTRAAEFLPADIGDDPALLVLAAEVALCTSHQPEARALLDRALACDAGAERRVRALACSLGGTDRELGYLCVEAVTGAAVSRGNWDDAASALQDFLEAAPGHIPALNRLVEISVDGDLNDRLLAAQAQLCDAYLAADHPSEARVIAEDLTAREPSNAVNVERWRRALVMLGEADPDAVIAEHLAQQALFSESAAAERAQADRPAETEPPVAEPAEAHAETQGAGDRDTADGSEKMYRLSAAGIDVRAILGEETEPTHDETPAPVEIDLSDALGKIQPRSPAVEPPERWAAPERDEAPEPREAPRDLDGVFEEFRQEVGRDRSADVAEQHYRLALTYQEMGLVDEATKALLAAVRSPRHRFESAALLGRIFRDRGMVSEAIEWFEHAAEAPASSVEAGHALLYDLGEVLEQAGESARALAVFLELRIDAGGYRDVARRIERLSQDQSGD
jgi:tetratricopeptide (TPR) repeat protein